MQKQRSDRDALDAADVWLLASIPSSHSLHQDLGPGVFLLVFQGGHSLYE